MMLAFTDFAATPAARPRPGRAELVGPNAVLQLAASLREAKGEESARATFADAAALDLYHNPPSDMIDERVPARLFLATLARYGLEEGGRLLLDAGRRTGDYVAEHRVPSMARRLLRIAPRGLAVGLLLRAIEANAWTFAGSGRCRVVLGRAPRIEIAANPLAAPGCTWHRGVFERLFERLLDVSPETAHPLCCAQGAHVCAFDISLPNATTDVEARR